MPFAHGRNAWKIETTRLGGNKYLRTEVGMSEFQLLVHILYGDMYIIHSTRVCSRS